jgi:hypothetical protein
MSMPYRLRGGPYSAPDASLPLNPYFCDGQHSKRLYIH